MHIERIQHLDIALLDSGIGLALFVGHGEADVVGASRVVGHRGILLGRCFGCTARERPFPAGELLTPRVVSKVHFHSNGYQRLVGCKVSGDPLLRCQCYVDIDSFAVSHGHFLFIRIIAMLRDFQGVRASFHGAVEESIRICRHRRILVVVSHQPNGCPLNRLIILCVNHLAMDAV